MLNNVIFAVIGAFFGICQYAATKVLGKGVASEKKENVIVPLVIKILLYALVAAAMILFFKKWLVWCLGGLATGIIFSCIIDALKNKSKQQ